MTDIGRLFLEQSASLLSTDYLPKIRRCVDELSDDDVWYRANETSNSIGNLMLHLNGNVRQWIVAGVGGRAFDRKRQAEFDERKHVPKRELYDALATTIKEACDVIAAVPPESLLTTRHIQFYDVTIFEAIYHVVEHFSMHTGQIILLAKARTGKDLKLWQPPE